MTFCRLLDIGSHALTLTSTTTASSDTTLCVSPETSPYAAATTAACSMRQDHASEIKILQEMFQ